MIFFNGKRPRIFDRRPLVFGVVIFSLLSLVWMMLAVDDTASEISIQSENQSVARIAVEDEDTKREAALKDVIAKDNAHLIAVDMTGASGEFGLESTGAMEMGDAISITHLGDPMISADSIDQEIERAHIGDPSLEAFSPDPSN